MPYGVRKEDERIDYDELERLAEEHKPKMIIAGAQRLSARLIDFARFRQIADSVGAMFLVDMAHISGLVAAGVHPNPCEYADIVTSTTHKTLRGPRAGMILAQGKIRRGHRQDGFPGHAGRTAGARGRGQGGLLPGSDAAGFVDYQKQVMANAQALAQSLMDPGFRIVSGGTDTHVMLLDVFSKGLRGKEAEKALDRRAHHRQQERHSVRHQSAAESQRHPAGLARGHHARIPRAGDAGSGRTDRAKCCTISPTRHAIAAVRQRVETLDRAVPALPLEARPGPSAENGAPAHRYRCPAHSRFRHRHVYPQPGAGAERDRHHQSLHAGHGPAAMSARSPDLPDNFITAIYAGRTDSQLDNVLFPMFLRGLSPDLVHIPLNRVPLLMIQPYVVTVHDLANLFFEWEEHSKLRIQLRRFRLIRGLKRASRVIAVSEATRRDVEELAEWRRTPAHWSTTRPTPEFLAQNGTDAAEERQPHHGAIPDPTPVSALCGRIRRHKNIPRLVEAFAVVREQLAEHPVYRDLRLVIIGDNISQFPRSGRR